MQPIRAVLRGSSVQAWVRRPFRNDTRNAASRRFIPRRALMYVPGSDERKLAKIPQLGADCICLDCEDGVAFNAKDRARENIRRLLMRQSPPPAGAGLFGRSECSVRVNSVSSGLCGLDVQAIFARPDSKHYIVPSAIHLAKVDEPDDIDEFAYIFDSVTNGWLKASSDVRVGLIIFVESAQSLINLSRICDRAWQLKEQSALIPEALVFGSDDFVADIGAVRTKSSRELLYARQKVVTCAKAYGMQAIDLVHIDYKDLEGLRDQSVEGACMGFTGKQVIHPSQIPVVHEAFAPGPERVEWAAQLVREFREHEETGKGAFTFRGSMIDMPLVKQAENILVMHEAMSPSST